MSTVVDIEGRIKSALTSNGVGDARAAGMAHYVSLVWDEVATNAELRSALQQAVTLHQSGAKVAAGVRHAARAATMGSARGAAYMTYAYKGGAGVLGVLPDSLARAGIPVDERAMVVAKTALEVAQNVGNRAAIASGVLAVFHDRFTTLAARNEIALDECSMAIAKLALNAAAAAAIGTTGLGLVVAALALLGQAKDTMAMYEVCTR